MAMSKKKPGSSRKTFSFTDALAAQIAVAKGSMDKEELEAASGGPQEAHDSPSPEEALQKSMANDRGPHSEPVEEQGSQVWESAPVKGPDSSAKVPDRATIQPNGQVKGYGKKPHTNTPDRQVSHDAPVHEEAIPPRVSAEGLPIPSQAPRVVSTPAHVAIYELFSAQEKSFLISYSEITLLTGVKRETARKILLRFSQHKLIKKKTWRTAEYQGIHITILDDFAKHKPRVKPRPIGFKNGAQTPDGQVDLPDRNSQPQLEERKIESIPPSLEEVGITSEDLFADIWPALAKNQCGLGLILKMADFQKLKFGKATPELIRQSLTFADADASSGKTDRGGKPIGDWQQYIMAAWKKDNRYPRPQGFLLPEEILEAEKKLGRRQVEAQVRKKAEDAQISAEQCAEQENTAISKFWASDDARKEEILADRSYPGKVPNPDQKIPDAKAKVLRTWLKAKYPDLLEYIVESYGEAD